MHRDVHMRCRDGQLLAPTCRCAREFAKLLSQMATSHSSQTPITKKALDCDLSFSSQSGAPAPRSFAQHRPAGPGPPLLLLTPPVPLALWPVPLGGLLRGARPCWAPALPGLSFLGSRGPAPLCGAEQAWTSCSAWGSSHPTGCSEPSHGDTGLSWAPGLRHTLFPGPGLPAPPRERSRGTKSVFCGEPGTGLAAEASDSPSVPSGDAGAGLVAGALGGPPCSVLLCVCACCFSLRVCLVLSLP